MNYIRLKLPIYASANFIMEKPDNWDQLADSQKYDLFMENMKSNSSLCHQCSKDIETNFETDTDYLETYTIAEFIEEYHES